MTRNTAALELYGINEAFCKTLHAAGRVVIPRLDEILENFYSDILSNPAEARFFRSKAMMAHAKKGQKAHWENMLSGEYNARYFATADIIGVTHFRIGLPMDWYFSSYSQVGAEIQLVLIEHSTDDRGFLSAIEIAPLILVVTRALMFDAELAVSAFQRAQADVFSRQHMGLSVAEARAAEVLRISRY